MARVIGPIEQRLDLGDAVWLGDNLDLLPTLASGSFNMIYIDPPFNTGRQQVRTTLRTVRGATGDRKGFGGHRYTTTIVSASLGYADAFDDYLGFLRPRLVQAHRLLAGTGTLYVHLDYREVHYVKVALDEIFGRRCFLNEIIWAYDYGAKTRRRWPTKHDTVLVYVKDPDRYWFDANEVDREPYMAPGLAGARAAAGKLPTDVWWWTIVSPTGSEKTGYPTQKPERIIERMMRASTRPGDRVLDFFAGSGTTGVVARRLGRRFLLMDHNPEAVAVIERRLADSAVAVVEEGVARAMRADGRLF